MQETFEAALLENWDDLETHHAYAKWMTEQGDARGELARCQILLENPALSAGERNDLRLREQALIASNRQAWLAALTARPAPWSPEIVYRWERGWVVGLSCRQLEINDARRIAASLEIRFLRDLEILTDAACGTLRKTDRLAGFPFRQFPYPKTGGLPYSIFPLATSPYLGNVRKLAVGLPVDLSSPLNSDPPHNSCRPDALLALVSRLPRLEHLFIAQIHNDGELTNQFSLAGPLPALRELELYYLRSSDISLLSRCPSLGGVRRLTLHASLSEYGVMPTSSCSPRSVLAGIERRMEPAESDDQPRGTFYDWGTGFAAPHLGSLESLRVYRDARGDRCLSALTDSPLFGRLRELSVVCSHVTDAGAKALIAARPRSTLSALDLSFGIFSSEVLRRLRDAYPFLVAYDLMTPEAYLSLLQATAARLERTIAEGEME